VRNNASETAQRAIREHFEIVAANILRVEQERIAAEPVHLKSFGSDSRNEPTAGRFRAKNETTCSLFYRVSRDENRLEHEEALRDSIVRVLMSPNFC